jgi:hypothetical protein
VTVTDDEELKASSIAVATVDGKSPTEFTETGDTTDSTYTYEATISGVSDGTYSIDVTNVEDLAGNAYNPTEGSAAEVTVDTAAPTVSSYTVTNPTGQDVQVSFTTDEQLASVSASVTGSESATLSGFASSGGDFSVKNNGDGTYTYTATYAASTDGTYTITLDTAEDAAGNNGAASQSDSVTVDTTAPSLTGATQTTSSSVTTVTVTLSDSTTGIDASTIDQADFSVSSASGASISGFDATGVTDGDKTATVTITLDGDYSTEPVTVSLISGSGGISDLAGNSATSGSVTAQATA